MGTPTTITVTLDGDKVTILREGVELPLENYDDLVFVIQQAYRKEREQQSLKLLDTLPSLGKWIVPKKRSDVRVSGKCVYFAQCDAVPGAIRIGYTSNLSNHTKALQREHDADIKVIAFVRCDNHKEIEHAFHIYFAYHIVFGDKWFEAEPVLEYLRTVLP